MNKDLLTIQDDVTKDDFDRLMERALAIKADIPAYLHALEGKTIVLIFDKPSLRTRVTFEVAMCQFGGKSIYMPGQDISLGKRESVADGARNLSRWVDGIVMRTFGHDIIVELARHATVPVINALTDLTHPCQALACMLTLKEHLADTKGKTLVFVGDGNNVAHSLMLACPYAGMNFTICCPEGYDPEPSIVAAAKKSADEQGTVWRLERDPKRAVRDAALIYTDVWASMGQESETESRARAFAGLQVNAGLMAAAPSSCLVSHCLPAHRGEEIASDVLDSAASIAFDEAENRLHIQKAVIYELLRQRP